MTTTDDTDAKPNRRMILSAVGALAGFSAVTGTAIAQDGECPEWDPAAGGQTSSLMCDKLPEEHHEGDNEPWYESTITFQNCSSCTRLINTRVTGGHINEDNTEEPHESDQTGFLSYHIEAGERKAFWFTGSINNFDISEHADMNVAISQRSIEHAQVPHCYRTTSDPGSTMGEDNVCPGDDPAAGGRTTSLKCDELPEKYHEGDTDPWYESSITFQNCSSCTRQISVGVTGGHIHESNAEEPHESDQTRSLSYHIEADERKTFWFTGSIGFLDLSEHADMNVAISQRSIEHAQGTQCHRS